MFLIKEILNLITSDIRTTLFTALFAFILYKLIKFYVKVYSLPPGPFPLPFLGNIKYLFGTKEHLVNELENVADKYGPLCTVWLGNSPLVLISDVNLAQELCGKKEFGGRSDTCICRTLFTNEQGAGIAFVDYGNHWEAIRKVAHSAAVKYSTTDKLVYLISDCVDYTVKSIIQKEGLNKPFVPFDYIYSTFLNISTTSAFGKRYELDDPEYKSLKYALRDLLTELNNKIHMWEMIPILRRIQRKDYNKLISIYTEKYEFLKREFKSHYKDYNESIVRDYCDTLISAKNDALKEGKGLDSFFTDENLSYVLFDLIIAGNETSQMTTRWIVFFMTYYPNVLKKLRKEIETQIGDRIPTHEDRERCHYVMAVISETLRLRNILPLSVIRRALHTSKLGNYTIPKDTPITVFQGHIMHMEKYWPNGNEFIPERFLENGEYIKKRPKGFIPFGVGHRICLGEKLAYADLFLVLVRFIQKTSDYDIVLHYSGDIKPDPKKVTFLDFNPKEHKISFNTKK